MKLFVVFATLIIAAFAADDFCYKDVIRACKPTSTKQTSNTLPNCNAKYGAIDAVLPDLQAYVTTHITRSYEYLLMSTHYANYEKNREGFEKLFRDLSDSKWDTSIDLIKYITKRGGTMDFNNVQVDESINGADESYELYELESVAKALDIEKQLAVQAHKIHGEATRRREEYHDPEVSSYIENEFVHKHAKTIRTLSGHAADLSAMLSTQDKSLALFIFDEYLNKHGIF